jgi:hypothetical protein
MVQFKPVKLPYSQKTTLRYKSQAWNLYDFHHLVVPARLNCLWIPAFAGMTWEAKGAVIGDSSENPLHRRGGCPPWRTDGVGPVPGKLSLLEPAPGLSPSADG